MLFWNQLKNLYSPWNVLLSHLNGERTMNERWTHAEWTVCERRTEFGERWTVSERRTPAERKRER